MSQKSRSIVPLNLLPLSSDKRGMLEAQDAAYMCIAYEGVQDRFHDMCLHCQDNFLPCTGRSEYRGCGLCVKLQKTCEWPSPKRRIPPPSTSEPLVDLPVAPNRFANAEDGFTPDARESDEESDIGGSRNQGVESAFVGMSAEEELQEAVSFPSPGGQIHPSQSSGTCDTPVFSDTESEVSEVSDKGDACDPYPLSHTFNHYLIDHSLQSDQFWLEADRMIRGLVRQGGGNVDHHNGNPGVEDPTSLYVEPLGTNLLTGLDAESGNSFVDMQELPPGFPAYTADASASAPYGYSTLDYSSYGSDWFTPGNIGQVDSGSHQFPALVY
ncbi:hypothetical protein NMY22_g11189 [Coprinellus aureogranulatus]|nr:hypothetical protein NMY22_g11189 [Coprinellus aureogranulatus]